MGWGNTVEMLGILDRKGAQILPALSGDPRAAGRRPNPIREPTKGLTCPVFESPSRGYRAREPVGHTSRIPFPMCAG